MSLTREQLYDQVWARPMLAVAKDHGVSGNYFARVCAALNVPWPPRGYWAKVAAGQKPKRTPLPPARPGELLAWSKGVGLDMPPSRPPRKAVKSPPAADESATPPEPDRPTRHALVTAVREFFDIDRITDNGYLRPRKRLLVDIVVSRPMLTTALDVANEMFLMLERHGHRVTLAPGHEYWHRPAVELEGRKHDYYYREPCLPDRPTVVFVKSVVFGLTLYECSEATEVQRIKGESVPVAQLTPTQLRWMQRNYTWKTTKHLPTGRLALRAYEASGVKWQQEWVERKAGELPHRFRTIRRALLEALPRIEEQLEKTRLEAEERRRQWEIEKAKRDQEERERREREAYEESREQLLAIVDRWALARRVEEFFQDIEQRTAGLEERERAVLHERLNGAREMLGTLDAVRHFNVWRSPAQRLQPWQPEA